MDSEETLVKAITRLTGRTAAEKIAARDRLLQHSRPPRPLPEGETLFDAVCGKWPGDESDEQVFEALRKLS